MSDLPRVEARPVITSGRSVAVLLCPFRLCEWHSEDVRYCTSSLQDAVVRWHLLDDHRDELAVLAGLHGAPEGVCARPHPTEPGRWCTEERGHHFVSSHGDGRVDRWLQR